MYYKYDITGAIGIFAAGPGEGWTELDQEEINAYLLQQAKDAKKAVLSDDLEAFSELRFTYGDHTFNLSESGLVNIGIAGNCTACFMFYGRRVSDNVGELVDFADSAGWTLFSQAINDERDRIMKYSESKKIEICAAQTVEAVDAITINFSV